MEALEEAERWQPDLILLDMKMPNMDGWTFAKEYRRRPEPRAEIVVLTAARDASAWAAEIDADGVLAKPFELDALYEVVERHAPGL
jgi:CheY-like chemotaxis protein